MSTETVQYKKEKTELRKEIGFIRTSALIIGSVIGSGIFVSPKGVLVASGSVGLTLLVWVLAGFLELLEALCFAELGLRLPVAGGGYRHLKIALGNVLAAFYLFKSVVFTSPGGQAVIILTFAKYTMALLPVCGSPETIQKLIACAALATIVIINSYSSRLGTGVAVVTTIGKLSALVIIIVGGLIALSKGQTGDITSGFDGTSQDPASLAMAIYSAKFAYSGAGLVAVIAGEIKNPGRTLPRSIVMSLGTVIVVYILTNISYLAALSRNEMLQAEVVAVEFANRTLGLLATWIPVAVMVSTFGAANNHFFSTARMIFAAGRDRNAPDFLCFLSVHQCTPLTAMLLNSFIVFIMILSGDAGTLISYLGFISSFFDVFVMISFIVLRMGRWKNQKDALNLPLVIPAFMVLVNVYLFVAPLALSPKVDYAIVAAAFFATAGVLYLIFIRFRFSLPFYDEVVTFIQLLLNVCPPEMPPDELHIN